MASRNIRRRLRYAWPVAAFLVFFTAFIMIVGFLQPLHHEYAAENCTKPTEPRDETKIVCESFWEKTRSDPAAFYTLLLAAFTGGLAFYTARLWRATIRLGKDSERSIKAAEDAAVASAQQAQAANALFIASNPPRLTVRFIRILSTEDKPLCVRFMVANTGRTRAIITASSVALRFMKPGNLGIPNYWDGKPVVQPGSMEPGRWDEPDVEERDVLTSDVTKQKDMAGVPLRLHLVGQIDFMDANHTLRRVAFCREYNHNTGRFTPVQDADYEYSD